MNVCLCVASWENTCGAGWEGGGGERERQRDGAYSRPPNCHVHEWALKHLKYVSSLQKCTTHYVINTKKRVSWDNDDNKNNNNHYNALAENRVVITSLVPKPGTEHDFSANEFNPLSIHITPLPHSDLTVKLPSSSWSSKSTYLYET
jgi:hypothetical protein